MTATPPTRSSTPASRIVIPVLHLSPSISGLHAHSHTSTPIAPPPGLESSASSVTNLDLSDSILIQDVDADVETADVEEATASGHIDAFPDDEVSKKTLRDQLRRTLSRRLSVPDIESARARSAQRKGKQPEMDEITADPAVRYAPRQYFILTDAGKPVFTSPPDGTADTTTATIGIMQALISVFIDDGDKLRCVNAGRIRISFLLRAPLYYVCASSWGEPESVTRAHLEYLHLQILSVVTAAQLRRIFERRTNFDLRRMLNGAETFLTSLVSRLEFDLALSTSSLHCLQLDPNLRKRAADALVPPSKIKDVLYVILVACEQVVTLIRPRKHSIHPADIHILLNTVHAPSIVNSPASASWIPVCLPKFNSAGFVNAYISFLRKETDADAGLALVCISGSGDFDAIRGWCDAATQRLETEGVLAGMVHAVRGGATTYSASALGIAGLRHFVYKSRAHVQVTMPAFEDPYDAPDARRRLTTLYQLLHDAVHAKSGQGGALKLQYVRTAHECVMGWITQPFELYVVLSPRLPKSAVVGAANAVARWVKKEEGRLFLWDAPVF